MENIAHIEAMTVLAVGIIFGMGALGTAIGFALFFTFAKPFVEALRAAH